MRLIGTLASQDDALTFSDYLITINMPAHIEQGRDGSWQVWIERDDDQEQSQLQLRAFLANPNDPKYADVSSKASRIRKEAYAQAQKRRRNYKDVRTSWSGVPRFATTFTTILVGLCIAIFLLQRTKLGPEVEDKLFFFTPIKSAMSHFDGSREIDPDEFSKAIAEAEAKARAFSVADAFSLVAHGQVWRLITPAFMHGGMLHLVFNCYYVLLFGAAIESLKGPRIFVALVLVSAIISNCGQAFWQAVTPNGGYAAFLGLSGINYALFGYVWMRGKVAPGERLGASQQTVGFMLAWLLLCMTGMMGPIANAAHLIGLLVGVIFGYWPRIVRRMKAT